MLTGRPPVDVRDLDPWNHARKEPPLTASRLKELLSDMALGPDLMARYFRDPEAVMDASMLPPDVGSMVPNMPNGNGGEHLMGLALRDAREVFEREYLVAQISRFGGNISRTAEFVGMERSALHRKLKALGIG